MDKTRIFVSYRREDSRFQSGRLYDHLVAHFGPGQVFKDVDSIPLGSDFRRILTEQVASCDVFLAVIGDAWFTVPGKGGIRRLDDPADFVRIEIEAALSRDIPVIPVLVGDSSVPQVGELPKSLSELAYRHGLHVRADPDFRNDVERLIRGIKDAGAASRAGSAARGSTSQGPEDSKSASTTPAGRWPQWPLIVAAGLGRMTRSLAKGAGRWPRARWPLMVAAAVFLVFLLGVIVTMSTPPKLMINSIGMKLVLVPPGEFLMGSPGSDVDAQDGEKPQHPVRIRGPFYLGATEVTQGQYQAVTGQSPSQFKESEDLPVENVSWDDAIAFCNKLTELEKGKLGGASYYRLPTEAEWEYACRAGSTTKYSFGDNAARLGELAWYDGNSGGKTHPVGQKQSNAFNLYDMHGNVGEWCQDWYDKDYYGQSPGMDPLGPSRAEARVVRGGSYSDDPRNARAAYRNGHAPKGGYYHLMGFRVARVQSDR